VTEIVLPAPRCPLEDGVKPSVQVVTACATCEAPAKVTLEGVAPEMVIAAAGSAAVVSCEVAMLKPLAAYEPAAGFVIPAIVRVPAVELARAQVPPELDRVMVTTCPVVEPAAAQLEKPVGKVIVGVAGIAKPAGKVAEIVLPAAR
jgi:hypothetical protein